jgi:transcription termination factor Rho
MSVDATQLERSALEAKDRDELATIATAMGGKPGSRARKGDIIDQILDLAGVTPDSSGGNGNSSGGGSGDATESAAEAVPQLDLGGADEPKAERSSRPSRSRRSSATAGTSNDEPKADDGPADEPPAKAGDADAAEGSSESARSEQAEEATTSDDKAEQPDEGERSEKASTEQAERSDGDKVERSDGDKAEKADGDTSTKDKAVKKEGGDGQRGQRNRDGNRDGDGQKGQRNRDGNQGNQGGGNQGGGNRDNQGNQQGDAEPGNRRRRRRGRDRDRQGGGQGQDRQGGGDDQPFNGEPVPVEGMLDLRDEGYGFLRVKGFLPSKDDVYVSVKQVRQFGLRKGDQLHGSSRPASRNEKNPALLKVDKVNDEDPEVMRSRPRFEDLTPLFPDEKLALEVPGDPTNMTARIVDLVSPVGKGQRGLIVSPPKAGKTTIMKQIAKSIETNNPEVKLIVLLVDERPEEVTDMRRWISGDVVASTFDRPSDEHTQVAELALERAKRLVEEGKDVVIILDGITRLARAYNLAAPATGRIMSGGIDTGALYPPKKFFGSARNIEEGGSLTILATALVETGSRMDEVIFEEFKGTGNMELRLDRRLADRRIYPAIDVDASSTRHEELLFERKELQQVWKLRRVLSGLGDGGGGAGLELLIDRMRTFKSNDEFLSEIAKAGSDLG